MKAAVWKHKSKYKGKTFWANYEKKGLKRVVNFRDIVSGKEMGPAFSSIEVAKKAGWYKI